MQKSETMKFRLDAKELEAFALAADTAGLALSAWVRERLRRAARIELEEAGLKIPFVRQRQEQS